MIIHNNSDKAIRCIFDQSEVILAPRDSFDCREYFNHVSFSITDESYSILQSKGSKLLKCLSFLDDPFNLIKEYHLTVVSTFSNLQLSNYHQINLTVHSCYADIETRTYYNFINVASSTVPIIAEGMKIFCMEQITDDFTENNRKLIRWQAVWDIFFEPLLLETVGYLAIYKLFSLWFGTKALMLVMFLLGLNITIELFMFLFKRKKLSKRCNRFLELLCEDNIRSSLS